MSLAVDVLFFDSVLKSADGAGSGFLVRVDFVFACATTGAASGLLDFYEEPNSIVITSPFI